MLQGKGFHGAQRGAVAVEYGILVALVAGVVMASVALLGTHLAGSFCDASANISAEEGCVVSDPAAGSADDSSAALTGGGGGGTAGGGSVTAPEPSHAGTLSFSTAIVEQDQRKRDLSARFNLAWSADDPDYTGHPESVTVDVTWTPALDVDQVITGETGRWDYTLVEPGHLRLTRTGTLDEGGFNPEPEILLTKSNQYETVSVTFTAEAAETPSASATSSTVSNPRG